MLCKKSNTANLMWDASSKVGKALTKDVMDGTIKKEIPPNLVKKSNHLWKPYHTSAFCCAFQRIFTTKKRAEQKAKDKCRVGMAHEKMCGTTSKNGKCFLYMLALCQCQVLTCIVSSGVFLVGKPAT